MGITMHVDVVSAEESIFSGPVEMLVAPAEAGEIGVLPRHTPLLTRIRPGAVRQLHALLTPRYRADSSRRLMPSSSSDSALILRRIRSGRKAGSTWKRPSVTCKRS